MGDVPKPPVPDIVIEVLGGEWPEGSETAMYALAEIWDRAADDLEEVRGDATTALNELLSNIESESKEPMRTSMNKLIEDEAGLKAQVADCRALADLCRGYGGDLEKTKWIINVAMVEAVASLAFAFFGPLGFAAAAAKMAAKKVMIKAAIKAAISKIASKGAMTTIKTTVKKAPTIARHAPAAAKHAPAAAKEVAKEVATQSASEWTVDQLGRRIAAFDGSTSTSLSESNDAAWNGALYGGGSSLTRRAAGGRGGRAGRLATEAGAGVAGTTTSALGNGEVPDAKDLGIGATEGLLGGNHHGAGGTSGGTTATANPGAGANVAASTPSVSDVSPVNGSSPSTSGGDPGGPGPGPAENVTPGGDPGGPGPVEGTAPAGGPGGPGPGQTSAPLGDPGGSGPGPIAGEFSTPATDGGGPGPIAGEPSTPATDGGANPVTDAGAGADGSGGNDTGHSAADVGGQEGSGGNGSTTSGESAGADAASGTDNSSGSGGESAPSGADSSGNNGDSSSTSSDSSTPNTGTDASSTNASAAGEPPPGTDHLSGLDLGGTGADSSSTTSSNITDAAGLAGDSGTSAEGASAAGGGTGGDSNSVNVGGAESAGDSTTSGSTPGGETTGADQGGMAAAPPMGAAAAGAAGGGSASGPSPSSSTSRGPDGAGQAGTDGQSDAGEGSTDRGDDPPPGGESVTPEHAETDGFSTDSGSDTDTEASIGTGGDNHHSPASDSGISAEPSTSSTTPTHSPDGLPSVDHHDAAVTPAAADASSSSSLDDGSAVSDVDALPDTDHLSGLDLPESDIGTPSAATTPAPGGASGGAMPSSANTPSAVRGGEGGGRDHGDSRPDTTTHPADVDTTDCARLALESLGERHSALEPLTLGDRGLDPVPAGDVFDAAGITPDVHTRPDGDGPQSDDTPSAYDEIADRLTELGDGSSALVTSNWTAGTSTGGHAYLAHNDGGHIVLEEPTSGEYHAWPPTYSDVGNVAAGYVNPDGTPADGHSTADEATQAIGDVDANKKPATYTDWQRGEFDDFHSDFSADNHTHPDGDIHEQITHTRTATLPTGEKVTIEERSTSYEHGHPPGQDPAPRDGERVTVTTTSVSSQHDLNLRNTVTWTEHGDRTVNAEINLRHSFEGMGRTSEETGHQREVSGGIDKGTNQHGAIQGDHAGHIAAHRFMLDQGLPNLFPQNGNFNTSAYKTMENEWAALVNDGLQVEGTIELQHNSDSKRPTGVTISYESDTLQLPRTEIFQNTSGQIFERS